MEYDHDKLQTIAVGVSIAILLALLGELLVGQTATLKELLYIIGVGAIAIAVAVTKPKGK